MSEPVKARADAIICGAGPAGLAAALLMSRKGLSVTVLERKPREQIGRPVRVALEESALSKTGLSHLKPPLIQSNPLAREFVSPDGRHKIKLERAHLVRTDHRSFCGWLADAAEKAGARLVFETTITGPIVEMGKVAGVVGTTADGRLLEMRAPLSIDASGIFGALRHNLEPGMGIEREIDPADVANAWQSSFRFDREIVLDLVHQGRIRPQVNVVRTGAAGTYSMFSIYVDLDSDRVDITAALPHDSSLPTARDLVEAYVGAHSWVGELLSGGGGLVPVRRPLDSFVADGFACLGDAACHTMPLTGMGVSSAIFAAAELTETAVSAIGSGDISRSSLWPFNKRYMDMRGSCSANAELFRRFITELTETGFSGLFRGGLFTADGVRGALEGCALELPLGSVLSALPYSLSRPKLLWRLYLLSRHAERVLDLYGAYPATSDPDEFLAFKDQCETLFAKWPAGVSD